MAKNPHYLHKWVLILKGVLNTSISRNYSLSEFICLLIAQETKQYFQALCLF